MNSKPTQIILIESAARGLAWIIAGRLGVDVVTANSLAHQIVLAVAAIAVAGTALYHSWHDRRGGASLIPTNELTAGDPELADLRSKLADVASPLVAPAAADKSSISLDQIGTDAVNEVVNRGK